MALENIFLGKARSHPEGRQELSGSGYSYLVRSGYHSYNGKRSCCYFFLFWPADRLFYAIDLHRKNCLIIVCSSLAQTFRIS